AQGGNAELVIGGRLAPVDVLGVRTTGRHHLTRHEPVGVVEAAYRVAREVGDGAVPVGGAVDGRVVAHDQLAVGGGVHVELEGVGAGLQRLPHGEQRARRRLPCTALVGIVEDPSPHPRVVHARQRTPVGWAVVLDHHAAEEHLQADVLLGDLTWETSYSLPGEGLLPRVRVDVTLDWSTWSQTAYRSWV